MSDAMHIGPWDPSTSEGFVGAGFYVRRHGPFRSGDGRPGHEHHIDHVTLIKTGTVRIEWEYAGRSGALLVDAPNFVLVPAAMRHCLTAETDDAEWCCVFSEHELEVRQLRLYVDTLVAALKSSGAVVPQMPFADESGRPFGAFNQAVNDDPGAFADTPQSGPAVPTPC